MKRRNTILSFIILAALLYFGILLTMDSTSIYAEEYSEYATVDKYGQGTKYKITTEEDFERFLALENTKELDTFVLLDNITIHQNITGMADFKGTFDGNGHKITIENSFAITDNSAKLFTSLSGTIRNVVFSGDFKTEDTIDAENSSFSLSLIHTITESGLLESVGIESSSFGTATQDFDYRSCGMVYENYGVIRRAYVKNTSYYAFKSLGAICNRNFGYIEASTVHYSKLYGLLSVGGIVDENYGYVSACALNYTKLYSQNYQLEEGDSDAPKDIPSSYYSIGDVDGTLEDTIVYVGGIAAKTKTSIQQCMVQGDGNTNPYDITVTVGTPYLGGIFAFGYGVATARYTWTNCSFYSENSIANQQNTFYAGPTSNINDVYYGSKTTHYIAGATTIDFSGDDMDTFDPTSFEMSSNLGFGTYTAQVYVNVIDFINPKNTFAVTLPSDEELDVYHNFVLVDAEGNIIERLSGVTEDDTFNVYYSHKKTDGYLMMYDPLKEEWGYVSGSPSAIPDTSITFKVFKINYEYLDVSKQEDLVLYQNQKPIRGQFFTDSLSIDVENASLLSKYSGYKYWCIDGDKISHGSISKSTVTESTYWTVKIGSPAMAQITHVLKNGDTMYEWDIEGTQYFYTYASLGEEIEYQKEIGDFAYTSGSETSERLYEYVFMIQDVEIPRLDKADGRDFVLVYHMSNDTYDTFTTSLSLNTRNGQIVLASSDFSFIVSSKNQKEINGTVKASSASYIYRNQALDSFVANVQEGEHIWIQFEYEGISYVSYVCSYTTGALQGEIVLNFVSVTKINSDDPMEHMVVGDGFYANGATAILTLNDVSGAINSCYVNDNDSENRCSVVNNEVGIVLSNIQNYCEVELETESHEDYMLYIYDSYSEYLSSIVENINDSMPSSTTYQVGEELVLNKTISGYTVYAYSLLNGEDFTYTTMPSYHVILIAKTAQIHTGNISLITKEDTEADLSTVTFCLSKSKTTFIPMASDHNVGYSYVRDGYSSTYAYDQAYSLEVVGNQLKISCLETNNSMVYLWALYPERTQYEYVCEIDETNDTFSDITIHEIELNINGGAFELVLEAYSIYAANTTIQEYYKLDDSYEIEFNAESITKFGASYSDGNILITQVVSGTVMGDVVYKTKEIDSYFILDGEIVSISVDGSYEEKITQNTKVNDALTYSYSLYQKVMVKRGETELTAYIYKMEMTRNGSAISNLSQVPSYDIEIRYYVFVGSISYGIEILSVDEGAGLTLTTSDFVVRTVKGVVVKNPKIYYDSSTKKLSFSDMDDSYYLWIEQGSYKFQAVQFSSFDSDVSFDVFSVSLDNQDAIPVTLDQTLFISGGVATLVFTESDAYDIQVDGNYIDDLNYTVTVDSHTEVGITKATKRRTITYVLYREGEQYQESFTEGTKQFVSGRYEEKVAPGATVTESFILGETINSEYIGYSDFSQQIKNGIMPDKDVIIHITLCNGYGVFGFSLKCYNLDGELETISVESTDIYISTRSDRYVDAKEAQLWKEGSAFYSNRSRRTENLFVFWKSPEGVMVYLGPMLKDSSYQVKATIGYAKIYTDSNVTSLATPEGSKHIEGDSPYYLYYYLCDSETLQIQGEIQDNKVFLTPEANVDLNTINIQKSASYSLNVSTGERPKNTVTIDFGEYYYDEELTTHQATFEVGYGENITQYKVGDLVVVYKSNGSKIGVSILTLKEGDEDSPTTMPNRAVAISATVEELHWADLNIQIFGGYETIEYQLSSSDSSIEETSAKMMIVDNFIYFTEEAYFFVVIDGEEIYIGGVIDNALVSAMIFILTISSPEATYTPSKLIYKSGDSAEFTFDVEAAKEITCTVTDYDTLPYNFNLTRNKLTITNIDAAYDITIGLTTASYTVTYQAIYNEKDIVYTKSYLVGGEIQDLTGTMIYGYPEGNYTFFFVTGYIDTIPSVMPVEDITIRIEIEKANSCLLELLVDGEDKTINILHRASTSETELILKTQFVDYSNSTAYFTDSFYLWGQYGTETIFMGEITSETGTLHLEMYTITVNVGSGLDDTSWQTLARENEDITLSFNPKTGKKLAISINDVAITDDMDGYGLTQNTFTIEDVGQAYILQASATDILYSVSYTFEYFLDKEATTKVFTENYTYGSSITKQYSLGDFISLYTNEKVAQNFFITGLSSVVPDTMGTENINISITVTRANLATIFFSEDDTQIFDAVYYISGSSTSESALYDGYYTIDENLIYYSKDFYLHAKYQEEVLYLGEILHGEDDSYTYEYYTVTYTMDSELLSVISSSNHYKADSKVELVFSFPEGYKLTLENGEDATIKDNTIVIEKITSHYEFSVDLAAIVYGIYYYKDKTEYQNKYAQDKLDIENAELYHKSSFAFDSKVTLEEVGTITNGYKLVSWYDAKTNSEVAITNMPNENVILYGVWIPIGRCELTVNLVDGTTPISDASILDLVVRISSSKDTFIELTSGEDSNYSFIRKNTTYSFTFDSEFSGFIFIKYPDSEYQYYASIESITEDYEVTFYKVNASSDDHSIINGLGWYTAGTITLSAVADIGYRTRITNDGMEMINQEIIIKDFGYDAPTYVFESYKQSYTLTYMVNGHVFREETYLYEDSIDWKNYVPSDGKKFLGWVDINGEDFTFSQMPAGSFNAYAHLSEDKEVALLVDLSLYTEIEASMFMISKSMEALDVECVGSMVDGKLTFSYLGDGYLWLHDPYTNEYKYLGVLATDISTVDLVSVKIEDLSKTSHLTIEHLGYKLKGTIPYIVITPDKGYTYTMNTRSQIASEYLELQSTTEDILLSIEEVQITYYVNYIQEGILLHSDPYHYQDPVIMWEYEAPLGSTFAFEKWSKTIEFMEDYSVNIYAQKKASYIISEYPVASKIHEGMSLKDSSITGGEILMNSTVVRGSYSFKNPNLKPNKLDSLKTLYEVTFQPEDMSLEALTFELTIEVCNPKFTSGDLDEPILIYVTDSEVKISMDERYEYTLDGQMYYQGGIITFERLKPQTTYTILYRYREDQYYCQSDEAILTYKTLSRDQYLYEQVSISGNELISGYEAVFDNESVKQLMANFKDEMNKVYGNGLSGEEAQEYLSYMEECLALMLEIEKARGNLNYIQGSLLNGYAKSKLDEISLLVEKGISKDNLADYQGFILDVFQSTDKLIFKYQVNLEDYSEIVSLNSMSDTSLSDSMFVSHKIKEIQSFDFEDYDIVNMQEFEEDYLGGALEQCHAVLKSKHTCDGTTTESILNQMVYTAQCKTYKDYKFDREAYDQAFYLAAEAAIVLHIQSIMLNEIDEKMENIRITQNDPVRLALYEDIYRELLEKYSNFEEFRELYYEIIGDDETMTYDKVVDEFKARIDATFSLPVAKKLSQVELVTIVVFALAFTATLAAMVIFRRKRGKIVHA